MANVVAAVGEIRAVLMDSIITRATPPVQGKIVANILERCEVGGPSLPGFFEALRNAGIYGTFLQTAHPRYGREVRSWLAANEVRWDTIHSAYEYDISDSVDFLAGFGTGMGFALAEIPEMIYKLAKSLLTGDFVDDARKFFDAVMKLLQSEVLKALKQAYDDWVTEFDRLIYEFKWFEAGAKLGGTLTTIALMGEAGAKLAAKLPGFVKAVPYAALRVADVSKAAVGIVVKSAQQGVELFKAIYGVLYVLPDLRFSYLLFAIATPGELRALLGGLAPTTFGCSLLTKTGFELLFIESANEVGALPALRTGGSFGDFVPKSVIVVRRNGQIIGRIHHPRSLASLLNGVADTDIDKAIDALAQYDDVRVGIEDMPKIKSIINGMVKNPDLAAAAGQLNLRTMFEEFQKAAASRRDFLKATSRTKVPIRPNPSTFGTAVESAMKPTITLWELKYPTLSFERGSFGKILEPFLRGQSRLLDMTVEEFVRYRADLARMIEYDGKNLAKVLATEPGTRLRDLKVDLFIRDIMGHQGMVVDYTSFFSQPHFNKTLLYHAIINEVFPAMRLPVGEMYHFGPVG